MINVKEDSSPNIIDEIITNKNKEIKFKQKRAHPLHQAKLIRYI
jgi:hypothetical protein